LKLKKKANDHIDEKQFSVAVKRLADSLAYGADCSPFLGTGIDYVQSRQYQPGDSVKSIDWKVTARTGRYFVKEYEAPKQLPIYIVLDTSASMNVSSVSMSKYAWAVQLAAGLAMVAQYRMSPVGLMGCGCEERDLHYRPTLSKSIVMQWAHELRHYDLKESTSLGKTLRRLTPSLQSNSLVMVISDLHDEEAISALKFINQEHDCLVLMLQDPAETGRTGGGIFRAQEAETGHTFISHGRKQWFDPEVYLEDLKKAGIDTLLMKTDEPFLSKLRNFLKNRDVMGKGRI
jgi:uncharacterized protein (DUF58 family)